MSREPAKSDREHPVFNLEHWIKQFPLDALRAAAASPDRYAPLKPGEIRTPDITNGPVISSPAELACVEQVRAEAAREHDLGEFEPADVFTWNYANYVMEQPWQTRYGGEPWRSTAKPWPTGKDGRPLTFIGQICFADSRDLFDYRLPGDVVLLFASVLQRDILDWNGLHIEWSSIQLNDPVKSSACPIGTLRVPIYRGVIHRTRQYSPAADDVFEAMGLQNPYNVSAMHATQIGTWFGIPQGWPFAEGSGETLVCSFSSVIPYPKWPFGNLETIPHTVLNGIPNRTNVFDVNVADGSGLIVVYRDVKGRFGVLLSRS